MIQHSQYYTSKHISDLVIKLISADSPHTCLELSAGEGALLESVKKRWPDIHCTTFDIDSKNIDLLHTKFPNDLHFCVDATGEKCLSILKSKLFDIAVCNPPFSMTHVTKTAKEYLKLNFGDIYEKNIKIRTEVMFLAINMMHIKENGTLAFIVPELIIKGYLFEKLRSILVKKYTIKHLIECDYKSFSKTEAKTFVILIEKSKPSTNYQYSYMKIDNEMNIKDEKKLNHNDFISKQFKKNRTEKERPYIIFRGSLSGKECKLSKAHYLHTTNMAEDLSDVKLDNKNIAEHKKTTKSGDIIIARVGSRILGKTNIISSGNAIISDCLFAIRFDKENDREIFLSYWKKNRTTWLEMNSTGTCAKHITISKLSELIDSILKY